MTEPAQTFQASGTVHAIRHTEGKWGAGGGRFVIVVAQCGFSLPERVLISRPRYGYSLLKPDCHSCLARLEESTMPKLTDALAAVDRQFTLKGITHATKTLSRSVSAPQSVTAFCGLADHDGVARLTNGKATCGQCRKILAGVPFDKPSPTVWERLLEG